jgi:hypothetical protein
MISVIVTRGVPIFQTGVGEKKVGLLILEQQKEGA